ncbi:unnamed protein product [Allacma fusca]|uniref:Uncharacterized protein n=1 Tax=Allacma fusca TaxID=39272 RepID=A0A8J2NNQ0_9HEXA|nr:unnamed protein product [Allacma fusca]
MGRKERIVCVSGKLGKIGESWSEPVVTGILLYLHMRSTLAGTLPCLSTDGVATSWHNNITTTNISNSNPTRLLPSIKHCISNFTRVVIIRDGNIVPCQFRDDYTVKLCKFWTICSTIYLNLRACSLME